ncbi:transglutaminaseTgpA domain-containing protein [Cutibacterium sp. V947]|uniref:transglutaminase family protein n=1 Tax=unclassified Cutibacterium TaxID=2649671 RepID=UPI003EE1A312
MNTPRRAAQPESRLSEFLGPAEQPPEYSHEVAIHLAVALAMILATLSLSDLTTDPWYWIGPTAFIVVLEALALLCRRHHWDHAEVQGVQAVIVVIAAVMGGICASAAGSSDGFLRLYRDTITLIQTTHGPLPPSIGVIWLATTVVGVLTVLTDLFTITLESPGWSLAPLLVTHLAAVLAATDDAPWWSFVLVAAGWLLILAVDHALRGGGHLTRLSAVIIGAITIALATVLTTIAPVWGHVETARPSGVPSAPVHMRNPTIDLRRNLHNTSTTPVIDYLTNSPDGEYLRTTSLSKMTDRGWGLIPVDLKRSAPGQVPGLTGHSQTRTVDVTINGFSSQYLPAPYGPIDADVDQTWAWDPDSLTIVSTSADHDHATDDMQYSISAQEPDPDPATFDDAKAGTPDNTVYTDVPDTVPTGIKELTQRVVKGKTAPVVKAIAIQNWLRDGSRFHYDINAPEGDGFQILETFLLQTHRGYCIHFAASMALMARIEGIPSRVSVGFLPGDHKGDSWKVRANQMHAWPELYFQGYGWVRFEPTATVAPAPAWTRKAAANPAPTPTTSASPTPSPQPSASMSSTPSPAASSTATTSSSPVPVSNTEHRGVNWPIVLGVLIVLLLLVVPMLIRILISRRRLSSDSAADTWHELRSLWIDHGLPWPDGTPRRQATALTQDMDESTGQAVHRLALAEERDRWSGREGRYDSMASDLTAVKDWLTRTRTPKPHWLAVWMPTSLFKR